MSISTPLQVNIGNTEVRDNRFYIDGNPCECIGSYTTENFDGIQCYVLCEDSGLLWIGPMRQIKQWTDTGIDKGDYEYRRRVVMESKGLKYQPWSKKL